MKSAFNGSRGFGQGLNMAAAGNTFGSNSAFAMGGIGGNQATL